MRKRLTLILAVLLSLSLYAQRYTVNGYIEDAASGERLIGATIFDSLSQKGVMTNNSGFYTLTLPKGNVALQVSYVGYHPSDFASFSLESDTLITFRLHSNTRLEEVVVTGHQSISAPESVQMSAVEIPVSQIKSIPALAGEVDVLKAIQLLPGVQSGSEGSAGLYVRGGGPDENLILLDGVPLYSVNHLMGFFSVFNADAVKNVTLYKGNFPSQYGGRLSSIIDVRQNDGNAYAYHGGVTVGLLAAKVNLEGYIPHKKDSTGTTTFNISARRTYFDLLTTPIMAAITRSRNKNSESAGGAYFYDINAKLTHTFADNNNKLSASFYMGNDIMYFNTREIFSPQEEHGLLRDKMGLRMKWGNIMAALNWEHRYTARLFSDTQISYTRYNYAVKQSITQRQKEVAQPKLMFEQEMTYNSGMQDVALQTHYTYTSSPNNSLNFGASYTYHQFRPEVTNLYSLSVEQNKIGTLDTTLTDGTIHGHEAALYVEDSYAPWRWLKLNIGVRASLYGIDGKVYPSIEPRVGLRAMLYKDLAFKASYSYSSQYIHLLSNSSVSLPTDLWVPVTRNIAPMHSMIVAAGLAYNVLGQCEISLEGYYKRQTNLLEYKDGASFFSAASSWQDKVALGDGWSYGIELLVQRKVGPVTGWVGYTWSRTMRQFDREGQEINFGKPFHAKYDREHDVSITLQYDINKRIDIAATFVYGTGSRTTFATQKYFDINLGNVDLIEERNNYQMPDYHRLDLGANFHFPHKYSTWAQAEQKTSTSIPQKWGWLKDAEHVLSVSVYNTYCRANPYLMFTDGRNKKMQQLSLFPILPSISYRFSF